MTGPPTPHVHLLGTTWCRRGPGYWARRVGLAVVYLAWLLLAVVFIGAIVQAGVSATSGVARVAVLGVASAAVGWSVVWAFRRRARYWRGELTTGSGTARPGLGSGAAASNGSTVASAFVFLGAFVAIGWLLTTVVDSLGRYLSVSERDAVAAARRWQETHGRGDH